jgi:hypothetical protein
MRKFVFFVAVSGVVITFAIVDKSIGSPSRQASLAGAPNLLGTRTAFGPEIALAHGIVQVKVTCMGSRILDVQAVQLPHDNNHSWQDSLHAAAVLRSEVISKQTTDLHAVSGATYTSDGYLQSLTAALELAAPMPPRMSPTPMG